ncbi:uncharacterized protein LOC130967544 [Arachis stenosperma]|uniref:uncharacterized protein LOC130967544 n=1 Tax=Arachis stenosperma TaxID=217475 RepID=UPI0025AB6DF8|nr:uncharacterized protein LOC130967544 [Arachis stenosperma]
MLQLTRSVSASAAFAAAWARRFPFLGVQVIPFSAIAPVPVSFLKAASTFAFSQFSGGGLHFTRKYFFLDKRTFQLPKVSTTKIEMDKLKSKKDGTKSVELKK